MVGFRKRIRVRGAAFAVGLVVGIAVSLVFLVWSFPGFRNPADQGVSYSNAKNYESGDDNPVVRPGFWETYTTPRDTYAQWIMAAVAIAATGVSIWAVRLVRDTLRETRRTANAAIASAKEAAAANVDAAKASADAARQFEVGQRPWLEIGKPFAREGFYFSKNGNAETSFTLPVTNWGRTPATHVHIVAHPMISGGTADGTTIDERFFNWIEMMRRAKYADRISRMIFPKTDLTEDIYLTFLKHEIERPITDTDKVVDAYLAVVVFYKGTVGNDAWDSAALFSIAEFIDDSTNGCITIGNSVKPGHVVFEARLAVAT